MNWTSEPMSLDSATAGPLPAQFAGRDAPDGDVARWASRPVGSLYVEKADDDSYARLWQKVKDDGRDDDWACRHVLRERVTIDAYTDGGGASGTVDLAQKIPAGAWVEQALLRDVTGHTGNTSATAVLGDGTDPDRYNTGTPSVFTTALLIDPGVPSGTRAHATEATVRVTVTGNSDFGLITAGAMTVEIVYWL